MQGCRKQKPNSPVRACNLTAIRDIGGAITTTPLFLYHSSTEYTYSNTDTLNEALLRNVSDLTSVGNYIAIMRNKKNRQFRDGGEIYVKRHLSLRILLSCRTKYTYLLP